MMNTCLGVLILFLVVITTTSSAQWKSLNTSFNNEIRVLVKAGNGMFAATRGKGVYYSANIDQTWIEKNDGLSTKDVMSLASNGTKLAAGTYGGGVFLSTNSGNTWVATGNTGLTSQHIYSIGFLGENILAGQVSNGFFLSTNNGANWKNVGGVSYTTDIVYVTPNYTIVGNGPYAYKTADNGLTWIDFVNSFNNAQVKGITETKKTSGTTDVFIASWDGVYVYTENGKTWAKKSNGLPFANTNCNAIVSDGQNLFVATETSGVYKSTDSGSAWSPINDGLPANTAGKSLLISNGILYLGTKAGVVWKVALSELGITSVKQEKEEIPTKFELKQNYPNPFNPETTIRYSITAPSNVSLKVYDILGNEVTTLVNEYQQTGSYSSQFSISNSQLTSGVYFYTLRAGNFSETKKMIIMK